MANNLKKTLLSALARDFDPEVEQQGVDLLKAEVAREVNRLESRK